METRTSLLLWALGMQPDLLHVPCMYVDMYIHTYTYTYLHTFTLSRTYVQVCAWYMLGYNVERVNIHVCRFHAIKLGR